MRISIVTISFNQGRFIEQAIRSVVDQTGVDLEYIVVDAGSADNSKEVIDRYRDRISRVIIEPDEGPSDGLNKGFAIASGDVFGFINSDDFLLEGSLERVVTFFLEQQKVDVVTGALFLVDECGRIERRVSSPFTFSAWRHARGFSRVLQQSTFFRSRAFAKTSGFQVSNRTCWDGELFVDMSLAGGRFGRIREPLACFRLHDQGVSGSQRMYETYRVDRDRILEKIVGYPPTRWLRAQRKAGAQIARVLASLERLCPL